MLCITVDNIHAKKKKRESGSKRAGGRIEGRDEFRLLRCMHVRMCAYVYARVVDHNTTAWMRLHFSLRP